jgi:hypothetical protein
MMRWMIIASIRSRTRRSTWLRPCSVRSSPSLRIVARTAHTWPWARLRTISKPGPSLPPPPLTLPPASSAAIPSISACGSFDRLASVRFFTRPPSR